MELHRLADLFAEHATGRKPYLEFVRSESLSVGLYVLPVGSIDRQQPHREDEVYVVLRGRSRFTAGEEVREVNPGDVIRVAAGVTHHFHDITAQLELIVVFAPPETLPEAATQGD